MRGSDLLHTPSARALRRSETFAEKRLWEQLRARRLAGAKFIRQAPIGPFVVDFLCRQQKLVVEIDGATHSTESEKARDEHRTEFLISCGYRVLRFQNIEVLEGMDQLLALIVEALEARE